MQLSVCGCNVQAGAPPVSFRTRLEAMAQKRAAERDPFKLKPADDTTELLSLKRRASTDAALIKTQQKQLAAALASAEKRAKQVEKTMEERISAKVTSRALASELTHVCRFKNTCLHLWLRQRLCPLCTL